MKILYHRVAQVSNLLGVISLLLSFLFRFVQVLGQAPYARGALICAGVLFLCALSSYAMTRLEAS